MSQPYGHPGPVTGIALPYYVFCGLWSQISGPDRSQQNTQLIWSSPPAELRIVGCIYYYSTLVTVRHPSSLHKAVAATASLLFATIFTRTPRFKSSKYEMAIRILEHNSFIGGFRCFGGRFLFSLQGDMSKAKIHPYMLVCKEGWSLNHVMGWNEDRGRWSTRCWDLISCTSCPDCTSHWRKLRSHLTKKFMQFWTRNRNILEMELGAVETAVLSAARTLNNFSSDC